MENKNEQQKQNLIWIFVILVLLIICIIMFIQNKKIEKMMAIINRNYDPYELSFDMRRTDNNRYLIERKMNKRTYNLTATNRYHIDFTYYLTVTETVTNRYLKFDPYCCSSKGQIIKPKE